jgi:uncharacterized protein (TIGR03382 family)
MNPIRAVGTFGALALVANAALAQSISPASYAATIGDVIFLADNTGSMGGVVSNAKSGATSIMTGLGASANFNFGVAHYYGDPSEGVAPSTSFSTLAPLSASVAAAQTAINSWNASGGGDIPEANYYALKQTASTSAWRPDAQHIVVWFGDAPSHTETTTSADAISALTAANAKVVAFNNGSAGAGLDGTYLTDTKQASNIIAATGGSLTNNFTSVTAATFAAKVTEQITAATSSLDLHFGSTLADSGLSLAFTCVDALGCDGVTGGQTRSFKLSITGMLAGTYAFDVYAAGVAAVEHDVITVTSVPEPEAIAMALGGLAVLGWTSRRRRQAHV